MTNMNKGKNRKVIVTTCDVLFSVLLSACCPFFYIFVMNPFVVKCSVVLFCGIFFSYFLQYFYGLHCQCYGSVILLLFEVFYE